MAKAAHYDALLIVSFGGPESPEDLVPFLENVLRGRNVPRARLLEVAEHYRTFGGKSPLNDQIRQLITALRRELDAHGIDLPIYWGNRNWHPFLNDTLQELQSNGKQRVLAIVVSSFSSYSGCRQYRENIEDARKTIGPRAPQVDKLRVWYNHPDFITANSDALRAALAQLPEQQRPFARVAFTAHSIPETMAAGCDYVRQLMESARLVTEAVGIAPDHWNLVFQSRSGRPSDPWLGPDINEHLRTLSDSGQNAVIVAPIGFLTDHLEVLYDLDHEARQTANDRRMTMVRAATIGDDPRFVRMLRKLIDERTGRTSGRATVGRFPAKEDVCPADCCLRMAPAVAGARKSVDFPASDSPNCRTFDA